MAEFNTVTDLRDYLATLLSAELGTFGNGIARIWIKPPSPPAGISSGLECIIQRTTEGPRRERSENQIYHERIFVFSLINFADSTTFNVAVEKVKASSRLTFWSRRDPRYSPATPDSYEQITFYCFDPIMINAA